MKDTYLKGAVMAGLAGLLWGFSGALGQFLFTQRGFDAYWLVSVRMLLGGAIMMVLGFIKYGMGMFDVWKDAKTRVDIVLYAIFCMAGVQLTYFLSIQFSNAATGTIIQYTCSAMVVVWVTFRAKRMPNTYEALAVICALIGIMMISTHGKPGTLMFSKWALIIGLMSAAMMAASSIQPKQMLRKYGTLRVTAWGIFLGSIIMMFVRQPWDLQGGTLDIYAVLAALGVTILGTVLSYFCYMEGVRIIGSTHAVLYATLEPLSSAVITIIWFKIPFGVIDWIGALLIISTVFLISMAPNDDGAERKKKKDPPPKKLT